MNKIISIVNNIKELNYLTLDLKRSYIINYTNQINNKYDIIFVNSKLLIDNIKIEQNKHLILFCKDSIENIEKQYESLLNNKATIHIIFDEDKIYCITKEKSIIDFKYNSTLFIKFINNIFKDIYFKTNIINDSKMTLDDFKFFTYLIKENEEKFKNVGKYLFGSIAIRTNYGFLTTIRGKDELSDISEVYNIDFDNKIIYSNKKASLNAPLLQNIFDNNKNVYYIVHHHNINNEFITLDYASPGTIRDSIRNVNKSFNIKHHGSFELYDYNFNLNKL